MYRGRLPEGSEMILSVQTTDGDGAPTLPDDAPVLEVYSGSAHLFDKKIPIHDRANSYFQYGVFLNFGTGTFTARTRWTSGSYEGSQEDTFEVMDGNVDGYNTAMCFYRRPHADYIVRATTSGALIKGKNPQV